MSNDTLKNRIHSLVAEQVGADANDITDATELRGEMLYYDDFDMIELAMAIEVDFNIEMDDEAVENARTVGDVIAIVQGRVPA